MRPWRSPFSTNSRDRKSIHTLWPCSASCSSGVVAMPDLLTRVGLHAQFALPGPAVRETRAGPPTAAAARARAASARRLVRRASPPGAGRPAPGWRGRRSRGGCLLPRSCRRHASAAGQGTARDRTVLPRSGTSCGTLHTLARFVYSSSSACRLCPLPNWTMPCICRFPRIRDSADRAATGSARDEGVGDRDAEAGLGVGQALVLAIVALALRVGED